MTPQTPRRSRVSLAPLALGACAVALVTGLTVTAASYTDSAIAQLGNGSAGSGVGNPNRFDIAVLDTNRRENDAATPAQAVVLPLARGSRFSETESVLFRATFVNRDPGVDGDLFVSIYDPDDQGGTDLFRSLRFSLYLDGASSPVVSNVSADAVNAAAASIADVAPGESVDIGLEVVIAPGLGISSAGKSTRLGLTVKGESR